MKESTDQELLREYASQGSEEAFEELVRRYVDLVHSTACRIVRDDHLAEDVTQAVFAALARQAGVLKTSVLTGWLHHTTRNLAANAVRTEVRRREREQEAVAMNEPAGTQREASWDEISPHLDAALDELNETDRNLVLLRYFQRKSAREMASILGTSHEAAQKRVHRAMEKLRDSLLRRGALVGEGALVLAISTYGMQAAPPALASAISATVIMNSTAGTATVLATTKVIAMTTFQKTAVATALAAAVVIPLGIQHEERTKLKLENQRLHEQLQARQAVKPPATGSFKTVSGELSAMERTELLRLRGEAGVLRQQVAELEDLRRRSSQAERAAVPAPTIAAGENNSPNDIASAKATILNAATGMEEKLVALRLLRAAGERPGEIVKAMVAAYHSTDVAAYRADIFRQLSGVTGPELKHALLHAVADPRQHSKVREEAAETLLGFLPDPDAQQWLEHLAHNEPDENVRSEAMRSLARYERKIPGR